MNVPHKTTNIQATHLLLMVVLGGGILVGLVVWLTDNKKQPCANNIAMLWEGEYPEPVVYISQNTTLTGYKDECLAQSKNCTLSSGLYHPWAATTLRYGMKKAPVVFEAKKSFSSERNRYSKGQHLYIEAKVSQQVCLFRVGSDSWQDSCPTPEEFKLISGDINKTGRKFFEAECTEGYRAWIEVEQSIFEKEGISRGVIQSYGRVAPP